MKFRRSLFFVVLVALSVSAGFAQQLAPAQIGRLTGEREATVLRHLTRTRRAVRKAIEHRLRVDHGFSQIEIGQCFANLSANADAIDLVEWLREGNPRNVFDRMRLADIGTG